MGEKYISATSLVFERKAALTNPPVFGLQELVSNLLHLFSDVVCKGAVVRPHHQSVQRAVQNLGQQPGGMT
jgi:hypothetical protein